MKKRLLLKRNINIFRTYLENYIAPENTSLEKIPNTNIRRKLLENSMPRMHKFLSLNAESYIKTSGLVKSNKVLCETLKNHISEYMLAMHSDSTYNCMASTRKLTKELKEYDIISKKSNGKNYYLIPYNIKEVLKKKIEI